MPDDLRLERRLRHPRELVWRALTEPGRLSQWYPLVVTELDRPRLFAFTEGDDEVRFELRPHDDGCLLVFTHRQSQAWPGASEGWQRCLDELSTLLTANPDAAPLATLSPAPDGKRALRFERRLGHPPAKVWRALTERDELRHWFAAHLDRDLTAGARVRFTMTPEAARQVDAAEDARDLGEGEVTVAEPPTLLEYLWTGQLMRWELTDDGAGGCVLVFTTVFDHDAGADEAAGWHAALEVLAAHLDGREVGWSPWDRVGPLTSVYRGLRNWM